MTDDIARIFRFGTIGFLVAVIYIGLYTVLHAAGMSAFPANTIAFLTAVAVQYVGQTCWTFRRQLKDKSQSIRFLTTIGIGLVYSNVITTHVGPAAGWQSWLSAGVVAVTLPFLNYIAFRLWVYRGDNLEESK